VSAASQEIDAIIAKSNDWRGEMLAHLRGIILSSNSSIIEEVKWKKPSKPEGVAVWYLNGNVCVCDLLKNAVRLTFPNGALVTDPKGLFNTRLDSKSVRAIDFREGERISVVALRSIVREAATLNVKKSR
jgi:hypothetical protein